MTTALSQDSTVTECFRLKGNLFTLTVLQLFHSEPEAFKAQLQQTIAKAPKFFANAPIVIDINDYQLDSSNLDFARIINELREQDLIPVGVRGGDSQLRSKAEAAGLAIMANSQQSQANSKEKDTITTKPHSSQQSSTKTKVITQPIRSGQQIYAKGGDLIVLSSVSPGAEILADGHIHVYGPLRGRALAGILGDKEARIFCQSLESELVSISGRYLVSEQLTDYKNKGALHIHLESDQLKFESI